MAELSACGDRLYELVVAAVDQGLQQLSFLGAEGAVGRKDVFVRTAFDRFELDADPFEQSGEVVAPQDHANRAGNGTGVRHDLFGCDTDINPPGGRDISEAGHHVAPLLAQA